MTNSTKIHPNPQQSRLSRLVSPKVERFDYQLFPWENVLFYKFQKIAPRVCPFQVSAFTTVGRTIPLLAFEDIDEFTSFMAVLTTREGLDVVIADDLQGGTK